jgi:iron complex transport system substrate-binding protein
MVSFKFSSLLFLLSSAAQAVEYPVGITNCHYSQWFNKPPERVAVASSGAVEIMLAMGLADRIISSAWVKEVWEPLMDDFQKFKHYDKYPSAQELMDSNPDMLYATYSSAFEDPSDPGRLVDNDRLNFTEALGLTESCNVLIPTNSYGENKTYCRDEIHEAGINTYLAQSYCEYAEYRPEEVSVQALYQEVWDLAIIFDAIENARSMVDGIESHFQQALAISQGGADETVDPIRVFWLDMFKSKSNPDEDRPFVGACCGGPQIVLDKAGAVNVFADQGLEDRRIWDRVEWDAIVESDPDLIVLIELSTESAGK